MSLMKGLDFLKTYVHFGFQPPSYAFDVFWPFLRTPSLLERTYFMDGPHVRSPPLCDSQCSLKITNTKHEQTMKTLKIWSTADKSEF